MSTSRRKDVESVREAGSPSKIEVDSPASAVTPDEGRWRGVAFGLQLEANFHARGVLEKDGDGPDRLPDGPARACSLALVCAEALEAEWPREEALVLRDLRDRSERRLLTIEEHPEAGYRLDAPGYGRYLVARHGRRVLCAPSDLPDWEWQAFMIGQVLPLAAVLQGLEPVHGSAVALGDHVIGLVADSHGGKSSLAVNLIRRGGVFVADDVLALERADGRILVHPGPTLASVRHAEATAIGPAALARLGTVVGHDEHELRVAMKREPRTLGLAALYFIQRSEHEPDSPVREIEPDPRLLLGNTFNGFVRTPARLVRQLDLYAQLARTVPTFGAIVSPAMDAYGLAGGIQAHASSLIEATR
jgi:hypothetical protein